MSALFPSFFNSRNPAPSPAKDAKVANLGSSNANFSNSSSLNSPSGQNAERRISAFSSFSRVARQNSEAAGVGSIRGSSPGTVSWKARADALVLTGLPCEWAEPFAKLLCGLPPGDFDHAYWARVLPGANMFADEWAVKAHTLGWTAEEVFGLDDIKPAARHDRKGLAWLLIDEARVIKLDPLGADIITRQGSRQRYYRANMSR